MTRGAQAFWTALATAVGLGTGLVVGRVSTGGVKNQKTRANIVLATSVAGAAVAGGGVSYYTTPKLLAA